MGNVTQVLQEAIEGHKVVKLLEGAVRGPALRDEAKPRHF